MKKKLLALFLVLTLTGLLFGCGESNEPELVAEEIEAVEEDIEKPEAIEEIEDCEIWRDVFHDFEYVPAGAGQRFRVLADYDDITDESLLSLVNHLEAANTFEHDFFFIYLGDETGFLFTGGFSVEARPIRAFNHITIAENGDSAGGSYIFKSGLIVEGQLTWNYD
jgi:hypothetical protein